MKKLLTFFVIFLMLPFVLAQIETPESVMIDKEFYDIFDRITGQVNVQLKIGEVEEKTGLAEGKENVLIYTMSDTGEFVLYDRFIATAPAGQTADVLYTFPVTKTALQPQVEISIPQGQSRIFYFILLNKAVEATITNPTAVAEPAPTPGYGPNVVIDGTTMSFPDSITPPFVPDVTGVLGLIRETGILDLVVFRQTPVPGGVSFYNLLDKLVWKAFVDQDVFIVGGAGEGIINPVISIKEDIVEGVVDRGQEISGRKYSCYCAAKDCQPPANQPTKIYVGLAVDQPGRKSFSRRLQDAVQQCRTLCEGTNCKAHTKTVSEYLKYEGSIYFVECTCGPEKEPAECPISPNPSLTYSQQECQEKCAAAGCLEGAQQNA